MAHTYALRSSKNPAVVAGVYPPGGWTPFPHGIYGYRCIGDGNCFWRAAAVQMYGDQEHYIRIRKAVVAYVKTTKDVELEGLPLPLALEASGFASVDAWVEATLTDRYFGGFVEAALLAKCYNYRVEIFFGTVPKTPSDMVFNPDGKLALRFHFRGEHYDALFVSLP
jgi:hypothetical protein